MSRTKLKAASEQIAAFEQQFVFAKEMIEWEVANPEPTPRHMIASRRLEDTDEWKKWRTEKIQLDRALHNRGWDGGRWTWDPDWDGTLVRRVKALADRGFEIQQFWRKQKIDMRHPLDTKDRLVIVGRIIGSVGEEWMGLNFKRTGISVWWQGGQPGKWYR